VTLWEVDIRPRILTSIATHNGDATTPPPADPESQRVRRAASDLGIAEQLQVKSGHGYLLQADLERPQLEQITASLLTDSVVESSHLFSLTDDESSVFDRDVSYVLHVLPKPGVMDPVAQSVLGAIEQLGLSVKAVRTFRKYWLEGINEEQCQAIASKILANDAIEQVVIGALPMKKLDVGSEYTLELTTVPLLAMDDDALVKYAKEGQLYLSLVEMQTIQQHFKDLKRDPTDIELETVAQTWSEHCSHKTLAGRIHYTDETHDLHFENMLKETIFQATVDIRKKWGGKDWCVSVFEDNAGIIRFDDEFDICFKVETHNHPSALEPYGGANTGIGGVIRDPMGTGMGAKPVLNTDVFCFARPDFEASQLPGGVLHPRRVMEGVVAGVRDYGNRMGIPTVNGAVYFDDRYLGNPLVYCGNVGILPRGMSHKETKPGDYIVTIGGRTGRDGIHGATFSSAELTHESESLSGGAVQIGNAITEKMVLDVLLIARDRGLYTAVTDCGAGGFSSAVGEMGEKIGAEVWLEKAPVKYDGLSYTEIWISEAQERMVCSVPKEKWEELQALCASEDVEANIIGKFEPTGRLVLKYDDVEVGNLAMSFLHDGRPPVIRRALYAPAESSTQISSSATATDALAATNHELSLLGVLSSLNVASKHWVIRQYDHEVQGGSVIKPLVGIENDGPSDAAVSRPRLDSYKGIALACGMNPYYGDLDTYHSAASAIDEAIRNCVAVGADPEKIAILDNFCWGTTDRPETLGSLVRAALACRDLAVAYETPFISGKDSLNNEFRPEGAEVPISIPPSLLISAIGIVHDARKCVTMDLKKSGNVLYQLGITYNELGMSHFCLVNELKGGEVPQVRDPALSLQSYKLLHKAITQGLVVSTHDLSEGGLATSLAEMAFAGGLGAKVTLENIVLKLTEETEEENSHATAVIKLFSESNSRFVLEAPPEKAAELEKLFSAMPGHLTKLGEVTDTGKLDVEDAFVADINVLKSAWLTPLDF